MNRHARRAFTRIANDLAREAARTAGVDPARVVADIAPSRWKAADTAWFAAHPQRAHRVRAWFPHEDIAPPGEAACVDVVAIRQVSPGMRIKQPFRWKDCLDDFVEAMRELVARAEHDESVAHALFDLPPSGDRPVCVDEVLALIDRYQTTTRQ